MLYIQCHIENHAWLNYLLEEFKRIYSAQFDFKLVQEAPKSSSFISYSKEQGSDIHLSIQDQLNPEIQWLDNDLFILEGTFEEKKANINFDLFWNAFYFLSRRNEWLTEKEGKGIQSYSYRTNINDEEIWLIPIVNHYFKILKEYLVLKFPNLNFGKGEEPILELSHDLDYIKKTSSLRIKQSAFRLFNGFKNGKAKMISNGIQFLFTSADYWNFDFWKKLEASFQMNSVFYIYSKAKKQGAKEWLFDPSYDISTNQKLRDKIKDLSEQGWRFGLHGSFESAKDFELLKKEKEKLEDSLTIPILKTRQHWLRFFEQETPFIHEQLFEEDSTIGWNNRIGFRAGIASKFRPYNHSEQRAFNYFVIPQIIMDSNIFDYGHGKEAEIIQQCKAMILRLAEMTSVHFSISWHPRTCHKEYTWQHAYKELIQTWKTSI